MGPFDAVVEDIDKLTFARRRVGVVGVVGFTIHHFQKLIGYLVDSRRDTERRWSPAGRDEGILPFDFAFEQTPALSAIVVVRYHVITATTPIGTWYAIDFLDLGWGWIHSFSLTMLIHKSAQSRNDSSQMIVRLTRAMIPDFGSIIALLKDGCLPLWM